MQAHTEPLPYVTTVDVDAVTVVVPTCVVIVIRIVVVLVGLGLDHISMRTSDERSMQTYVDETSSTVRVSKTVGAVDNAAAAMCVDVQWV